MCSGDGLPGIFGKPMVAAAFLTSVPSAIIGYLLDGIGVPFVTQSTSAFSSAARIGALGAGLVGRSQPPATGPVVVLKPPGPPPCETPGKKYLRTFSGSGISAFASVPTSIGDARNP